MATRLQKLYVSTICLLLVCNISICAQENESAYNTYVGRKPKHYLAVSLAGGEANNLTDTIKHLAGAGANLGLHYEVQYRSWIFGMNIEAQYQYLRDRMNPFVDNEEAFRVYEIVDPLWSMPFQDTILYKYVYEDYLEQGHHGSVAFSVYGGKEFTEGVYVLLGAKFTLPIITSYNVQTIFFTSVRYSFGIEDLRDLGIFDDNDLHDYGVFDDQQYSYHSTYRDYIRIAPFVELGYNIPIRAKKTKMRIGVYGSYGFRLGESPKSVLANYDEVDKTWGREGLRIEAGNGETRLGQQSPAMIQRTIKWNPLNQSNRYKSLPQNLEVGVKFTVLFDVTTEKKICNCYYF